MRKVRGREEQLEQISTNLQRVAAVRQSRVLMVTAASGSGKTRLLIEAANIADDMSFAVVNGVAAGENAVPGAAQVATGAQLPTPGIVANGVHSPRVTSTVETARARLRHAAQHIPTIVTLDDLHLADPSTLMALCDLILAHEGRPVVWLLAFTSPAGAAPSEPMTTCLSRLRGRVAVEPILRLSPLTGEALAHLVADHTGAVPDPAVLALVESVNDSPCAVIELVRGLMEDGDICTVDGTSRLTPGSPGSAPTGTAVGVPAPVPKRLSLMIEESLLQLSAPTVKSLRLAAVLGSPFAPEDLSAMLDESPAGLLTAVHEAVERGVLVCREEHRLAFRTEPIWRVLLDSVPPPVRALLRRQAAETLLSHPDGVERAALQLAHVAQPHDAKELDVIAEGARRLVATDPATAASLATRGMELLGPGRVERTRLANTAVKALTTVGNLDEAVTVARDAIDEAASLAGAASVAPAGDIAALQASMSTALLLRGDALAARRATEDALARQEGGFQPGEALVTHLAASYLTGDSMAVGRVRAILNGPDLHDGAVRVAAMTVHALDRWRDGQVGDAVAALRDAVALNQVGDGVQVLDPRWFLAFALTRIDEYEEAEAVVHGYAQTTASTARTPAAAVGAALRAPLSLVRGRLDEAEEAARAGTGQDGRYVPILAPQAWLVLAHVALRRGAPNHAEDHLNALARKCPQDASNPWRAARLLLQAQLAEAQAGPTAAVEVLAEIGTQAVTPCEIVLEDPAAAAWWVRCALAADRPDIARAVVDTTESLSARNPRVPAVLGAAVHARALAEADADALAEAGRLHRNPWAQATAAEDHAGILLDRGDHETAIAELDRAMNAYGALGGDRDAARVRARLRGLGVWRRHWKHVKRPVSGWDSLTETERKVAKLVAGGLTNQQTATHLFISPHTVGFHLRQIYRKLGIRSRSALIRCEALRTSRPEASTA
ncbi:LuxR C-terminal-related transcriptional regulator [Micromonospora sp. WMMA1363]|uniref:helix-turn-helix transcriptional regulator n=1 Tax=Micromonospora sp. WMMA1363 TaxID=3053985 RepID=UPI00259C898B|nr:LuxR family transcriptional regulator [Micromonospora sp. WMMA1363]MDM4722195.1 LuxR C-terminal-related transcriptional regulator [Micromonospora sp. WMMA1363]